MDHSYSALRFPTSQSVSVKRKQDQNLAPLPGSHMKGRKITTRGACSPLQRQRNNSHPPTGDTRSAGQRQSLVVSGQSGSCNLRASPSLSQKEFGEHQKQYLPCTPGHLYIFPGSALVASETGVEPTTSGEWRETRLCRQSPERTKSISKSLFGFQDPTEGARTRTESRDASHSRLGSTTGGLPQPVCPGVPLTSRMALNILGRGKSPTPDANGAEAEKPCSKQTLFCSP